MSSVAFFADSFVGTECIRYILKNHPDHISKIIIKDQNSPVLPLLKKASLSNEKILTKDQLSPERDLAHIDYIFLCWWPYLVRDDIINTPKHFAINFHAGLSPYTRGKGCSFWSIVHEQPWGITTHVVDHGVDTGDILFQSRIEKRWEDTGESLYNKAIKEIIKSFKSNYKKIIDGDYTRVKQNLELGRNYKRSEIELAKKIFLDKKYTGRELLNLLRAKMHSSYSPCYFYEHDQKYKVSIQIERM